MLKRYLEQRHISLAFGRSSIALEREYWKALETLAYDEGLHNWRDFFYATLLSKRSEGMPLPRKDGFLPSDNPQDRPMNYSYPKYRRKAPPSKRSTSKSASRALLAGNPPFGVRAKQNETIKKLSIRSLSSEALCKIYLASLFPLRKSDFFYDCCNINKFQCRPLNFYWSRATRLVYSVAIKSRPLKNNTRRIINLDRLSKSS